MLPFPIIPTDEVVILTGAGISAESGIPTFRDTLGLWRQHDVTAVASPAGWEKNPRLVWDFYSERRRGAAVASPNDAHHIITHWQKFLPCPVSVYTQNVDSLHEQARTRVRHLHGELFKSRCHKGCVGPFPDATTYEGDDPLKTCPVCGSPFRPDVVWFGEEPYHLDEAFSRLARCTVFLSVGTSGNVEPAAGFVRRAKLRNAKTIYVGLEEPENYRCFDEVHLGFATEVLPKIF